VPAAAATTFLQADLVPDKKEKKMNVAAAK
jgi:hypothetical protein